MNQTQTPNFAFTDDEEKYLKKMRKGEKIQCLSANDSEYYAFLDMCKIKFHGFFLCHVANGKEIYYGKIGKNMFQNVLFETDFLRVFIDSREKENLRFYVNQNGNSVKYSNTYSSDQNDEKLVIYLEDDYFAQFVLFDCRLPNKTSQIIVTDSSKINLRTFAFSYISQLLPNLKFPDIIKRSSEKLFNEVEEQDGE
ncbi:hypothetical protein EXW96_26605 [Paenibacillus sp. JMULE4]|uniref:hypothetical protein n=1 Tax=Paenibacillus sp. JMULE4 TaxID=2518342 RepID=UPI001576C25A|nr:hypothetical protein [Paenibacillus sp. JMULE4]NTZ20962.1 hypothetical protein [Paenibacillus sp. JMULE4]